MASILITGTSKGIGLETALVFARAGHTVHATMRNPARSPELAEMAKRENLPLKVSALDVDSDESVRAAIGRIHNDHGPVDVLVNNAGIERVGPVEEVPLSDFREAMETNYFGAIRCIQAVVGDMRKRRSGCIINVTSVAGKISSPPMTPYAASKWALEALSEGLAGEMKAFNVHVAIVEPGIIATDMARRIGDPAASSPYPHRARFSKFFSSALKNPVSPAVVGQKILEIFESGTWQLRHPVGPDAIPLLQWRNGMNDEQWVASSAVDDDTWLRSMGLDPASDAQVKAS